MSVTKVEAKAALVIIDLQKGLANPIISDLARKAGLLAQAFRSNGRKVVLVNVDGRAPGRTEAGGGGMTSLPDDWADLLPELNQKPEDYCVTKQSWGAFAGTDLDKYLKDEEITQVYMAGVATSIGVESTARQAYELGYNVVPVIDLMLDLSAEAHENSVERIFPKLGIRANSEEIVAILENGNT